MTRAQVIIIGIGAVIVLGVVLVFIGIIPGLKTESSKPVTLEFWGVESSSAFNDALALYKQTHKKVEVRYRELDESSYESTLVNALASGKGPDLFMVHSTWTPKHFDKMLPFGDAQISFKQFQDLFPRVAEQDFAPDGAIFALPLYIDTLALFYNKDIFDRKSIALPPGNWTEVQNAITKIREVDKGGRITLAGAALGGNGASVDHAPDILSLLMLQTGVEMTTNDFSNARFAHDGLTSLNFYTKFANPQSPSYTWSDELGLSLDAFAQGNVGIIFDYADRLGLIQNKNSFLRIGVVPMPQAEGTSNRVDYADYYGVAVSTQSAEADAAAALALALATDQDTNLAYLRATGLPPALRVTINQTLELPTLGVFARQALTARSWPQGDATIVTRAFNDMIQDVVTRHSTPEKAIKLAEDVVTQTMRRR